MRILRLLRLLRLSKLFRCVLSCSSLIFVACHSEPRAVPVLCSKGHFGSFVLKVKTMFVMSGPVTRLFKVLLLTCMAAHLLGGFWCVLPLHRALPSHTAHCSHLDAGRFFIGDLGNGWVYDPGMGEVIHASLVTQYFTSVYFVRTSAPITAVVWCVVVVTSPGAAGVRVAEHNGVWRHPRHKRPR